MMLLKTVALVCVNSTLQKCEISSCDYLIQELCSMGFKIQKIVFLTEDENILVHEFHTMLQRHDLVLTICSFGTSTINTICRAAANVLNQRLQGNEELNNIVAKLQKNGHVHPVIPIHANVLVSDQYQDEMYPIIYVKRLLVLSSDERQLQMSLNNVLKPFIRLFGKVDHYSSAINIEYDEKYEPVLEAAKNKYEIEIVTEKKCSQFTIKLLSSKLSAIVNAETYIRDEIESELFLYKKPKLNSNCIYQQIASFPHIKKAISCIQECFCKFSPENTFISFNGGKDCTVLLHLVLTVLKRNFPDYLKTINCMYVRSENTFEEVDEFVNQVTQFYNLNVEMYVPPIKNALSTILHKHPQMQACFMGTRKTDPFSENLREFEMTDPDWPQVMRVNPLLEWDFSHIWDYLLMFKVPYCDLYDKGYTSLGNITNTKQNPDLLCYDPVEKMQKYLPAYRLLDSAKERHGRIK